MTPTAVVRLHVVYVAFILFTFLPFKAKRTLFIFNLLLQNISWMLSQISEDSVVSWAWLWWGCNWPFLSGLQSFERKSCFKFLQQLQVRKKEREEKLREQKTKHLIFEASAPSVLTRPTFLVQLLWKKLGDFDFGHAIFLKIFWSSSWTLFSVWLIQKMLTIFNNVLYNKKKHDHCSPKDECQKWLLL